jgi:hypothetical protein
MHDYTIEKFKEHYLDFSNACNFKTEINKLNGS